MKKLLLFSILLFINHFSFAQAGTLDSTFDFDGLVSTDFTADHDGINSIAIQQDGKIIAAGYSYFNTGMHPSFAIVRYNTDGSLDTSFNGTGKLTDSIFGNGAIATAVTLQPDGKIIVAGNTSSSYSILSRYLTDGTPDSTFGSNGRVASYFGGVNSLAVNAITLFPNGQIVLGGNVGIAANSTNFALARYNNNGTLDSAFGNNGQVITNLGGIWNDGDVILSLVALADGKILAGGEANFFGPGNVNSTASILLVGDYALVQYDSTGALDSSFNGNGMVIRTVNNSTYERGKTALLQPDGKILLGGYFANDTTSGYSVLRFYANGLTDSTFGLNGVATYYISGNWSGGTIGLQADGKIVQSGMHYILGVGADFAVMRFDSSGVIDSTFGINGFVETDFGYQQNTPVDIKIQQDGKIVVAGYAYDAGSHWNFALARYRTDGSVGITKPVQNHDDFILYPNPVKGELIVKSYLLRGKKVELRIYDSFGRVVIEKDIATSSKSTATKIDVSKLMTGIYFVEVSGNGISASKKFCKANYSILR